VNLSGTAELRVIGTSTAATSPVVAGVATFPDIRVADTGTHRILINVGGARDAISNTFTILP
jgi:hypothetical protein